MDQSSKVFRRQFLKRAPVATALGVAFPGLTDSRTPAGAPDFCVVLADDWTYCDIGLSWGLKSCAHSITDCLAMTDYSPSVKACINLDALAYAMVAESYPDVRETGQFPRPSAGVAVRNELMAKFVWSSPRVAPSV